MINGTPPSDTSDESHFVHFGRPRADNADDFSRVINSGTVKAAPRAICGAFLRTVLDLLRNYDYEPQPRVGVRETSDYLEFAIFEGDVHVMDVKVWRRDES